MGQPIRPRFATAQDALRFYFRVRELVTEHDKLPARGSGTTGVKPNKNCAGVVGDFLDIAMCVQELDRFERWLLGELYGPTCFYARERTLTRAFEAAQRRFPGRSSSARELARKHRAAIDKLAGALRQSGIIGAAMQARMLREVS